MYRIFGMVDSKNQLNLTKMGVKNGESPPNGAFQIQSFNLLSWNHEVFEVS